MSTTKNILILTYDMIPYSPQFGACQRMYFLAEYLAEKNFNVTVVANKTKPFGFFGKQIHFDTCYFGSEPADAPYRKQETVLKKTLKSKIRKFLEKAARLYFNEPCNVCALKIFRWLNKYKRDILNLVRQKNIDTIIISGPPFVLFSMIKKIKKSNPTIQVVLDYRDPWALWNHQAGIPLAQEKRYLHLADKIVVVTEPAKEGKINKFHIPDAKIEVVYNGYSETTWKGVKLSTHHEAAISSDQKVKIAYIGSIDFHVNSYRDTTNFFKSYEDFRDKFELKFVGVEENDLVEKLRVQYPEVQFLPKVTHEESLRHMLESDVLLNLHTVEDSSGRYLIQGKIFDYMRSKKIIFSIGSPNDYTNVFIRSNNIGFTTENTIKGIKSILSKLFELNDAQKLHTYTKENTPVCDASRYSREYQNHRYMGLLMSLRIPKEK